MTGILLGTECEEASDELVSALNTVCENGASIDKFFLLRMKRASDVAVYCHPFRSEWSTGCSECELDSCRQSFFSVATDMSGIPVYFEPCSEMDMNIHSIRALVDHVIKMGAVEPAVILDAGSSSAENLRYLIGSGIGFLAPGGKKTPAIKQMLGQVVKKRGDPRALRRYNDRNYIVFDSEVAVCRRKVPKRPDSPEENNETDDLEIISMSDPRFSSIPFDEHMVAWACTENEGNTDRNREQMLSKLNEIESRLMEVDPYEALDNLKYIAGEYSKYFDLEVVEGDLVVKIRQKGVTAALNREGIFVVITYGLRNWNSTMSYYECVSKLEKRRRRRRHGRGPAVGEDQDDSPVLFPGAVAHHGEAHPGVRREDDRQVGPPVTGHDNVNRGRDQVADDRGLPLQQTRPGHPAHIPSQREHAGVTRQPQACKERGGCTSSF